MTEMLNENNLSFWKLKIRVVFRKGSAIEGRPLNIVDEMWKEIGDNVVVGVHLAMADLVLPMLWKSSLKDTPSTNCSKLCHLQ